MISTTVILVGEGHRVLIENARELVGMNSLRTGSEVLAEMDKASRLATGASQLDEDGLLGGFRAGSLVAIEGPTGAGKTQIFHHLAVMAQIPQSEGGLECSVNPLSASTLPNLLQKPKRYPLTRSYSCPTHYFINCITYDCCSKGIRSGCSESQKPCQASALPPIF